MRYLAALLTVAAIFVGGAVRAEMCGDDPAHHVSEVKTVPVVYHPPVEPTKQSGIVAFHGASHEMAVTESAPPVATRTIPRTPRATKKNVTSDSGSSDSMKSAPEGSIIRKGSGR